MDEKDARLAQRIIEAHNSSDETIDVVVYAALAAVRANAVMQERQRQARRLREIARLYIVREDHATAKTLAEEADRLEDVVKSGQAISEG